MPVWVLQVALREPVRFGRKKGGTADYTSVPEMGAGVLILKFVSAFKIPLMPGARVKAR